MQTDVNEIIAAAKAANVFSKITARVFKESDSFPMLYLAERHFQNATPKDTGAKTYDGAWQYPCYIYVQAKPDDETYSDYSAAEGYVKAFLDKLLIAAEWELADLSYYPVTLAGSELISAEVIVEKFGTQRYG